MGCTLSTVLRPRHPHPTGEHTLGCLRARLPPVPGSSSKGLLAQVHYPADLEADRFEVDAFPWFRPEVIREIANGYGLPLSVLSSLLKNKQLDASYAPKQGPDVGWPILVFTSGIWGSCEMYTQFCRELASCGVIVIALEHEDGSGVFATNCIGEPIPHAMDVPEGVDPLGFRQPFLEKHAEEISMAATSIQAVARGDDVRELPLSPAEEAMVSVLRHGDPEQLCLMGHSFGSTAVVRHLRHLVENSLPGSTGPSLYKGVLLMDLWSAPLLQEDLTFQWPAQVPVFFLISEMWHNSGPRAMLRLMQGAGTCCWGGAVVQGTHHQWVSESHFFAPEWLLKRIHIAGPGDLQRAREASYRAAHLALTAFIDPSRASQLRNSLVELDDSVMILP